MKGKRGGIIYYLSRQNKGRGEEHVPLAGFEPRTYSTAWASNSGEEKDSQKDPGSNTLYFFSFFFISNLKDVCTNPENSKSIKFCLHK